MQASIEPLRAGFQSREQSITCVRRPALVAWVIKPSS